MLREGDAPPLPCASSIEPGIHQVGAKMEGFRLPLFRRGMRTTLVSGSQSLNEVETSPGITNSAGPLLCTPGPGGGSSESLLLRAPPRRGVAAVRRGGRSASLWSTSWSLRSSRRRNSSSVMSSAVRARTRTESCPAASPFDLAGPPVHERGQLADVLGAGLAADRVLLPQDLDVDPLLLGHGVGGGGLPLASIEYREPVTQLSQDAVHLPQHLLRRS